MFRSVFKSGIRGTYNVLDNPTFTSEPWSIYPAKHKTTGRVVSVFIFNKTRFESQTYNLCSASPNSKNSRVIVSECYDLIRSGVNQLSKFRHPQVLQIYEVLEETKTKFLFVSEPISDTLTTLDLSTLDELSNQSGLLQIAKCLQFLHENGNSIHLNLQPSSICVNLDGDWKLSGLNFLQNLLEISPSDRSSFSIMTQSIVPFANVNLNYTAPELVIDNPAKLDFANDIWSLGCLVYYLFNHDNLINCFESNSINDYKREFQKFLQKFYNHRLSELKYLLKNIPEPLYPLLQQSLARYPHDRITITQFIESEYFNGSLIKAMWFVDEFSTKNIDEKLIFIKKLAESDLISEFPVKFKSSKLLNLMVEVITNELNVLTNPIDPSIDKLISYALTCVFKIGSSLSILSFQDRIFTELFKDTKQKNKVYTKLLNSSVRSRLTIVENFDILQAKANEKDFVELIKKSVDIFLTSSSSESADQQIKLQELFLEKLPNFIEKIEFPYLKNTLFPLLCLVFKSTTILSTKLATIEVFEKLVKKNVIDKVIIVDQLLPILKNLKSRDKRVVTSVLKFFVQLTENDNVSLEMENFVETILPQCFSLSFGCLGCNQSEFNQFVKLIQSIQSKLVEKKLATLVTGPANDFDSLVNSQKPNEVKKPQIKTEVMQPTRNQNLSKKPQVSTSTTLSSTAQPQTTKLEQSWKNESFNTSNFTAKKLDLKAEPLTLKPKKANPIVFSRDQNQEKNSRLLSTLNGTQFQAKEEDDFDDFQTANTIDWNVEVQKKIDIPLYDTTLNSHASAWSAEPTKSNLPPGFSANLVLTPGKSNYNNSYNTNNKITSNSSDFDFL